jgi:hypothetical protein
VKCQEIPNKLEKLFDVRIPIQTYTPDAALNQAPATAERLWIIFYLFLVNGIFDQAFTHKHKRFPEIETRFHINLNVVAIKFVSKGFRNLILNFAFIPGFKVKLGNISDQIKARPVVTLSELLLDLGEGLTNLIQTSLRC